MGFVSQCPDDWVLPIVRQYFETAVSGFPYINCPDELRPATASLDSWWVIYAPNYGGGVIVEGYRIEQWRERQRKLLVLWSILGLFLFYFCAFSGSWLILAIVLITWLALVPAAGWLTARSIFAKREWVIFPEKLANALQNGAATIAGQQAEEHRKQALPDIIGHVTGKVGGAVVETLVGKAAGQFSEITLEEAFKRLAQQLLHK
jgi:hypothetical protein